MSRSINKWRDEVEKILAGFGIRDVKWSITGHCHQRIEANNNGRPFSMGLALSPSDSRAGLYVKRNIRRILRETEEVA